VGVGDVADAADVSILMSNWGVPFGFNPAADLNNDGKVDALDVLLSYSGLEGKILRGFLCGIIWV